MSSRPRGVLQTLFVLAAGDICKRLSPVVRLAARRRGVRPSDVEEIVQDTLLEVLEAMRKDRIEDPTAVGAFAAAVARHVIADRARLAGRRERLWDTFGATIAAVVDTER